MRSYRRVFSLWVWIPLLCAVMVALTSTMWSNNGALAEAAVTQLGQDGNPTIVPQDEAFDVDVKTSTRLGPTGQCSGCVAPLKKVRAKVEDGKLKVQLFVKGNKGLHSIMLPHQLGIPKRLMLVSYLPGFNGGKNWDAGATPDPNRDMHDAVGYKAGEPYFDALSAEYNHPNWERWKDDGAPEKDRRKYWPYVNGPTIRTNNNNKLEYTFAGYPQTITAEDLKKCPGFPTPGSTHITDAHNQGKTPWNGPIVTNPNDGKAWCDPDAQVNQPRGYMYMWGEEGAAEWGWQDEMNLRGAWEGRDLQHYIGFGYKDDNLGADNRNVTDIFGTVFNTRESTQSNIYPTNLWKMASDLYATVSGNKDGAGLGDMPDINTDKGIERYIELLSSIYNLPFDPNETVNNNSYSQPKFGPYLNANKLDVNKYNRLQWWGHEPWGSDANPEPEDKHVIRVGGRNWVGAKSGFLDYDSEYLYYFEAPLGDWQGVEPLNIAFAEAGSRFQGNSGGGALIRIERRSQTATVKGYWDSPILNGTKYNADKTGTANGKDTHLPVGLQLKGYFYKKDEPNKPIKDVEWDQTWVDDGGKKHTTRLKEADGIIDFSRVFVPNKDKLKDSSFRPVETAKEFWDNLGQGKGRKFWMPWFIEKGDNIQFRWITTKEPEQATETNGAFSADQLSDFVYRDDGDKDRMRPAYVPVQNISDSSQKGYAKIMYYLTPTSTNGQATNTGWKPYGRNEFEVRIRPQVLKTKTSKLPWNPVAVSPYKDIVKWMALSDLKLDKTTKEPLTGEGNWFDTDIIPGFLKARCYISSYQAQLRMWGTAESGDDQRPTLDAWAPGYYYQDGGPWMIGDDQKIALHQNRNALKTDIGLKCYGIQTDPNAAPKDIEVPLKGLAMMDAESTDGKQFKEEVGLQTQFYKQASDTTQDYKTVYPIFGYSSCNTESFNETFSAPGMYQALGLGTGYTGTPYYSRGHIKVDSNTGAISFSNDGGRCGERFGDNWTNAQYGMLFGPALMAVAPGKDKGIYQYSDVNSWTQWDNLGAAERKTRSTVDVNTTMIGGGKEAIGFGFVTSGDTSNADFNKMMPPVAQYSSLNFYKGASIDPNKDYTLYNNYKNNFYYYGPRLGKTAIPYDYNNTYSSSNYGNMFTQGTTFQVRSGISNDALPHTIIKPYELGAGWYSEQPKVIPTTDKYTTGVTGADGKPKYMVESWAHRLQKVGENNYKLTPYYAKGTKAGKVTVTVPCGKVFGQSGSTWVRGWADFNGNGVFDPEEKSTMAQCGSESDASKLTWPVDSNNKVTQGVPATPSQNVTVTFDYPTDHTNIGGKQNVWMRLRAVGSEHQTNFLADNTNNSNPTLDTRKKSAGQQFVEHARAVDPDDGAMEEGKNGSVEASWQFANSGEAEDYMFDITKSPERKNVEMCVDERSLNAAQGSTAGKVRLFDDDRPLSSNPATEPNGSTTVFLSNQAQTVQIDENGKRLQQTGVGSLKIATTDDGAHTTIAYTAPSGANAKALVEDLKKNPRTYTYGYESRGDDSNEKLGNLGRIRVYGADKCSLNVRATMVADPIPASWALDNYVLKNNDVNEHWTKLDERTKNKEDAQGYAPLKYRLLLRGINALTPGQINASYNVFGQVSVNVANSTAQNVTVSNPTLVDGNGGSCQLLDTLTDNKFTLEPATEQGDNRNLSFSCPTANSDQSYGAYTLEYKLDNDTVQIPSKVFVNGKTDPASSDRKAGTGTVKLADMMGEQFDQLDNPQFNGKDTEVGDLANRPVRVYKVRVSSQLDAVRKDVGNGGMQYDPTKVTTAWDPSKADPTGNDFVELTQYRGAKLKDITLPALNYSQFAYVVEIDGDETVSGPAWGKSKQITSTATLLDSRKSFVDRSVETIVCYYTDAAQTKRECLNSVRTPDSDALVRMSPSDLNVFIKKTNSADNASTALYGAGFEVYNRSNDGTCLQTKPAVQPKPIDSTNTEYGSDAEAIDRLQQLGYSQTQAQGLIGYPLGQTQGTKYASVFEMKALPFGKYCLKETKAPAGHELLPEMIKFDITDSGLSVIDGGTTATSTLTPQAAAGQAVPADANKPLLTVRDVEVGTLPASGGRGVIWSLALGVMLAASGIVLRRRVMRV